MVGAYLFGSVAFPDYEPQTGDIDFYVVIRGHLTNKEISDLDLMHRSLAAKHDSGRKLDGFYIPLAKTRKTRNPQGLVFGSHGRIHRGGADDAWALHCEHFHGPGYIRLQGPRASHMFPTQDSNSIREALYRQLIYSRSIIRTDPWWAVLSLCRLVYSFKTGRIVISKLGAANWALGELQSRWHPLIRSAIRAYKKVGNRRDNAILKRDARKFLGFASVQIVAYDTVWDTRRSLTAPLRSRSGKGRK